MKSKKTIEITIHVTLLTLILGCSLPFTDLGTQDEYPLTINLINQRTIGPNMIAETSSWDLVMVHDLEPSFTYTENNLATFTHTTSPLATGPWSLEITLRNGSSDIIGTAYGKTNIDGTTASENILLTGDMSFGTGNLSLILDWTSATPQDVDETSVSLLDYGTNTPVDMSSASSLGATTLSINRSGIPVGYYLLEVTFFYQGYEYPGKYMELVHIYRDLTSTPDPNPVILSNQFFSYNGQPANFNFEDSSLIDNSVYNTSLVLEPTGNPPEQPYFTNDRYDDPMDMTPEDSLHFMGNGWVHVPSYPEDIFDTDNKPLGMTLNFWVRPNDYHFDDHQVLYEADGFTIEYHEAMDELEVWKNRSSESDGEKVLSVPGFRLHFPSWGWHMISFVMDPFAAPDGMDPENDQIRLYINGELEDSVGTFDMSTSSPGGYHDQLFLGARSNGSHGYYGSLDDLQIWDFPRAQSDLYTQYTIDPNGFNWDPLAEPSMGPDTGMMFVYPMIDGLIIDVSSGSDPLLQFDIYHNPGTGYVFHESILVPEDELMSMGGIKVDSLVGGDLYRIEVYNFTHQGIPISTSSLLVNDVFVPDLMSGSEHNWKFENAGILDDSGINSNNLIDLASAIQVTDRHGDLGSPNSNASATGNGFHSASNVSETFYGGFSASLWVGEIPDFMDGVDRPIIGVREQFTGWSVSINGDGEIEVFLGSTSDFVDASAYLNQRWNHVLISAQEDHMGDFLVDVYVNDHHLTDPDPLLFSSAPNPDPMTARPYQIGYIDDGLNPVEYTQGAFDDVRIYLQPLDDTMVEDLYHEMPGNSIGTYTPDVTPPTNPATGLMTNPMASVVQLDWSPSTDADIDLQLVYYKETASSDWIFYGSYPSGQVTEIVSGLANGVSYDFRIDSLDWNYNRISSSIVSATPETPPSPVSLTTEMGLYNSIFVSWDDPAEPGLSHIEINVYDINLPASYGPFMIPLGVEQFAFPIPTSQNTNDIYFTIDTVKISGTSTADNASTVNTATMVASPIITVGAAHIWDLSLSDFGDSSMLPMSERFDLDGNVSYLADGADRYGGNAFYVMGPGEHPSIPAPFDAVNGAFSLTMWFGDILLQDTMGNPITLFSNENSMGEGFHLQLNNGSLELFQDTSPTGSWIIPIDMYKRWNMISISVMPDPIPANSSVQVFWNDQNTPQIDTTLSFTADSGAAVHIGADRTDFRRMASGQKIDDIKLFYTPLDPGDLISLWTQYYAPDMTPPSTNFTSVNATASLGQIRVEWSHLEQGTDDPEHRNVFISGTPQPMSIEIATSGTTFHEFVGLPNGQTFNVDVFIQDGNWNVLKYDTIPFTLTPNGWVKIVTGTNHSLGIKGDGSLWAWGDDSDEALGIGSGNNSTLIPIQVGANMDWIDIAASSNASYGIREMDPGIPGGTLWAWGRNNVGQLGNGTTSGPVDSPIQVGSDEDWTRIETPAAGQHALAMKDNSTLYGWGSNGSGQLANASGILTAPTQMSASGQTTFLDFAAGTSHTLAIRTIDSFVFTAGADSNGQLGISVSDDSIDELTMIDHTNFSIETPVAVFAGSTKSFVITDAGSSYGFGGNTSYELGLPASNEQLPVYLGSHTMIATGVSFSVFGNPGVLQSSGWDNGSPVYGFLGTGYSTSPTTQNTATNLSLAPTGQFIGLYSGERTVWVTEANGQAYGWGANDLGQLGNNSTANSSSPLLLPY